MKIISQERMGAYGMNLSVTDELWDAWHFGDERWTSNHYVHLLRHEIITTVPYVYTLGLIKP